MLKSNKILLFIFSILLGITLLFPSAVQFAHIFEGHDHKPCKELTTHLHEKKTDCEICYFNHQNYTYSQHYIDELLIPIASSKIITHYTSRVLIFRDFNKYLRGPPAI